MATRNRSSDTEAPKLAPRDVEARFEADTRRMMGSLPEQLRLIVELRFGLHGQPRQSNKRIAATLGVKPAQTLAAYDHAMRALRHPPSNDHHIDIGLRALNVKPPPLRLYEAVEAAKALTPELIAHLKRRQDDLRMIPWHVFEHLVGEFLAQQGFTEVRLVGRDPRTSADIYATWGIASTGLRLRFFIEVKRWRHRVGITVINEVLGAMLTERPKHGWHASMIVATGGFVEPTKMSRPDLSLQGLDLKDRHDLLRWLNDYKPNANGLWLPDPERTLPD